MELRRTFWNLEGKLLRIERVLKALIVVVCLGGAIAFFTVGMTAGLRSAHAGWLFALGVLAVGLALWQTVSKITRHGFYFKPTYAWGAAFMLLALLFISYDWQTSVVFALLTAVTLAAGSLLQKWKYRRIGMKNWEIR